MDVPFEVNEYTRVLKLATQPDTSQFYKTASVAGIGIFLIGLLGFIMFTVMNILPP